MAPPQAQRKSLGRKKIEMKLIEDETARIVTFSKRRAGLFKKATELSILCGAHIAIIIFSLSGRAYSFGHPNVKSVIGRFSKGHPMPNPQEAEGLRGRSALLAQLKEVCDQRSKELEKKKKRGKELKAALESSVLSDENLSRLDMNGLQGLKEKLEKLRDDVQRMTVAKLSDGAGPSRTMDVDADVTEPLTSDQINLANVDGVAEPSSPKEINLAKIENSRIPTDWLKL